jgi:hypothetical protein
MSDHRDHRNAALLSGAVGAALVFLPLAAICLFLFGLRECTDCGPPSDLLDALLLSVVYAAMFGLLAGLGARLVLPHLSRRLRPAPAAAVLLLAIVAFACSAVWVAPRLYVYVQYLRTPRNQLPVGDPNRLPSECSKAKLPKDVICGV